ncbi:MAG: DMT family transporter, partial [Actinomycetota bacterium]|nr:DMT family transporter [Actinomycetota bacterium]
TGDGPSIGPMEVRVGIVMSLLSVTLPFASRSFALQYASAGFVGLATALVPLVTAIAAHFLLADEPLKPVTMVGLGTALVGVAVLVLSGDSGLGEGGRPGLAGALALVGVVSVALGAVYAKRYAGEYSLLGVAGVQFTIGALLAMGATLAVEGLPRGTTALGWASLVYIGLIGTFMPVVVYYWLIRHVTVTYSTIIGYIVPLVAVSIGVLALGEQIQPGIVIGGGLILAGVMVTDRLRMRASRETPDPAE